MGAASGAAAGRGLEAHFGNLIACRIVRRATPNRGACSCGFVT
jgi:hypothetical protein